MTAWDADRFAKWVRVLEHCVREREVAVRLVLLAVCAHSEVVASATAEPSERVAVAIGRRA